MTPALLLSLLATVGIGMPATAGAAPPPDSVAPPEAFDLQGHRGARGLAPENTIPAFRRALALGVTTLEMDVVISAWLLYTTPSPRDVEESRMPSSA